MRQDQQTDCSETVLSLQLQVFDQVYGARALHQALQRCYDEAVRRLRVQRGEQRISRPRKQLKE
jgi:hypothetical protein